MNESGPIRKTRQEGSGVSEFCDFVQISPNVWRATEGSRYWLLKCAKDNSTESVELLKREYELACDLQHPFIAMSIKFVPDTPKGPAIIMEYVEGRTLRDFILEKPDNRSRKKVLEQILDAVEHIHRKDLLHNDIKAENILVTNIGNNVKIIDFGLSETPADYLNRRLGGTAGASAPEVLSCDTSSTSNSSADIYALGGILATLFPNKYRFIRNKCLKENPEARYQDIPSLRAAIASRNRKPFVFCALALITLIIFLAVYLPNKLIEHQKVISDEAIQLEMQKMQEKMTTIYKDAVDSLVTQKNDSEAADDIASRKSSTYNAKNQEAYTSNINDQPRIPEETAKKIREILMQEPKKVEGTPESIAALAKSKPTGEALQIRVKQIQEALTAIYKESIDSISNPNIAPYKEFAMPILNRLLGKTIRYREKVEPVMRQEYDTINMRLYKWRCEVFSSLPSLKELHKKGELSDDEKNWYSNLAKHNKPYAPFSSRN